MSTLCPRKCQDLTKPVLTKPVLTEPVHQTGMPSPTKPEYQTGRTKPVAPNRSHQTAPTKPLHQTAPIKRKDDHSLQCITEGAELHTVIHAASPPPKMC